MAGGCGHIQPIREWPEALGRAFQKEKPMSPEGLGGPCACGEVFLVSERTWVPLVNRASLLPFTAQPASLSGCHSTERIFMGSQRICCVFILLDHLSSRHFFSLARTLIRWSSSLSHFLPLSSSRKPLCCGPQNVLGADSGSWVSSGVVERREEEQALEGGSRDAFVQRGDR